MAAARILVSGGSKCGQLGSIIGTHRCPGASPLMRLQPCVGGTKVAQGRSYSAVEDVWSFGNCHVRDVEHGPGPPVGGRLL
ncbi:hypothetical protein EMCRGX_G019332 [Ephydatia muelleri]